MGSNGSAGHYETGGSKSRNEGSTYDRNGFSENTKQSRNHNKIFNLKMRLLFSGGQEIVILEIDRQNKALVVTSSKTNNRRTPMEWKYLFDKGKEEVQERITDSLSDKLFIKAISEAMNKSGYILIDAKC